MNNNIEKENYSQNDIDYEEAYYMYETPEMGLFESTTMIAGLEFASIESLKKELEEQYGIIHFPEDNVDDEDEILIRETKLNEVIAKSELLWIVCKEGVFGWDNIKFEYCYYGKFNGITKRIKYVQIFEDRILHQGDTPILIREGHYQIFQEEEKIIAPDAKIEVFTIKQRYTEEHIKLPNSPGIFKVYESDLVLANFNDE